MNQTKPTICIIGGGPTGLFAAQHLASTGQMDVHVFEQKASVGRKFLIAGRGGLNLTHSEDINPFLNRYGPAKDFLEKHIQAFTPDQVIEWANELGVETFVGSSGRVFPKEMKATGLMRAWTKHLTSLGVQFHLQHSFVGIDEENQILFRDKEGDGYAVKPDVVLYAMGGASYPHLGSTGRWVNKISAKGIEVAPLIPVNCGYELEWSEHMLPRFAGEPIKNITLTADGLTGTGDMIVTEYGLEGGALYAVSQTLSRAFADDKPMTMTLNLRPHLSQEQIKEKLEQPRGKLTLTNFLRKKMKLTALEIALIHELADRSKLFNVNYLSNIIQNLPVEFTAPRPITRAISSMGGIDLDELDENLMLTSQPGWFAAGEMLNWDAPTGGYLLQGCFSTGKAAAVGIENWLASNVT
jgi:uncharacterized flavoprotein (TIGR03862 family)